MMETKNKVNGSEKYTDASKLYKAIAKSLGKVSDEFPFPPDGGEVEDAKKVEAGIKHLKAARRDEKKALKLLEEIIKEL